jgi:hypothetical protein
MMRVAEQVAFRYIVETAEWLATLDRKVEDRDITGARQDAARSWALEYTGTFSYMVEMRVNMKMGRRLSTGMARGILNCWRAELARSGRTAPAAAPVADAHGAGCGCSQCVRDEAPRPEPVQPAAVRNVHRKTYTEMKDSPWAKGSKTTFTFAEPEPDDSDDLFSDEWCAWAERRNAAFAAFHAAGKQAAANKPVPQATEGFRAETVTQAPVQSAPVAAAPVQPVTEPVQPVANGTYTIVEPDGGHLTLKVQAHWDDAAAARGEQVVKFLMGSDNESDYTGFAFLKGTRLGMWKRFATNARLRDGVNVLLAADKDGRKELGKAYALASGNCYVCNRKLTTPESIEAGIGPVCAANQEM